MRPLDELPAAIARDLVGVAFDVDDTLTTHGTLHPEAYAALWRLRLAGLRLVSVTGRPLGWTEVMASMWPVDLAVGENGAGWHARRDGAVRHGFFEDAEARVRQRAILERVRAAVNERLPRVKLAGDQGGRRCDLAFDVGERERLGAETVAQLVAVIEEHGGRALVSSVHAHVLLGEWDKARGVERAAREMLDAPIDRARWMFVGDSGNDAAAFELFEHTVGVANVRAHLDRLPCPPRFVTRAERGEGFVELADFLVGARRG